MDEPRTPAARLFAAAASGQGARAAQAGLRAELAELLGDPIVRGLVAPPVEVCCEALRDGYAERLLRYPSPRGGEVPAYLLVPPGDGPHPAVVLFHQHNSEWHLGKSEAAGVAGDPRQWFGPALARRGVVVIAPDSLCFEDRRRAGPGREPRPGNRADHLAEMAYHLVRGEILMTTVLADAATAISVLAAAAPVDPDRLGVVGHSYGGHVALFHAALDERVRFACISGAAGSYRSRIAAGTGIGVEQAIPGILGVTDFDGVLALIAPRPALLVSATRDPYAADAGDLERAAAAVYRSLGAADALAHVRVDGPHALDARRFDAIVDWVTRRAGPPAGA